VRVRIHEADLAAEERAAFGALKVPLQPALVGRRSVEQARAVDTEQVVADERQVRRRLLGREEIGDDRVHHRQQPVVDTRLAVPRVQLVIDAPVGVEIGEAGELVVSQQPLPEVGTHLPGRRVQRCRRLQPAEAPQRRGKRGERLMVQRDGPTAAQSLAHRRDDRLQGIVPIAVPVRARCVPGTTRAAMTASARSTCPHTVARSARSVPAGSKNGTTS
jgi:hypothetical protein